MANYTSAKNIVKLVYNDSRVDNKLNKKYIHQHQESYVLKMVIMISKN